MKKSPGETTDWKNISQHYKGLTLYVEEKCTVEKRQHLHQMVLVRLDNSVPKKEGRPMPITLHKMQFLMGQGSQHKKY